MSSKLKFRFIIIVIIFTASGSACQKKSVDDQRQEVIQLSENKLFLEEDSSLEEPNNLKLDFEKLNALGQRRGDYNEVIRLHDTAYSAYLSGDIRKAYDIWYEALLVDPSWEWGYFNLACMTCLMNDQETAVKYAEIALKLTEGSIADHMLEDSDLELLKENSEFMALIGKYKYMVPDSLSDQIAGQVYRQLLEGDYFIGFGKGKTAAFMSMDKGFWTSTIGGPDDPPDRSYYRLGIQIADLTSGEIIYSETVYQDNLFSHADDWGYINPDWDDDKNRNIFINRIRRLLPVLLNDYEINFSRDDGSYNFKLDRIEEDFSYSYIDPVENITFRTGIADVFVCINKTGQEFTLIKTHEMIDLENVFRMKDTGFYFLILYCGNGNGDTGDYGHRNAVAVFERGNFEVVELTGK